METTDTLRGVASLLEAEIKALTQNGDRCLIAIDGRCAAGKTTLAGYLQDRLQCSVIHMDHFFLRPQQRTKRRLLEPGGNIDYERFTEEVTPHFQGGSDFCYRPYDCRRDVLEAPILIRQTPAIILEGSYSCHPALKVRYDRKVFLTVSPEEQLRRIRARNGPRQLKNFTDRWIPLEEQYFKAFSIAAACDFCF